MTSQEALSHVCELIRMKAFDVLSVDPSRTGGLLGFQKLCAVCEGAGLQVVTHRALTQCISGNMADRYLYQSRFRFGTGYCSCRSAFRSSV